MKTHPAFALFLLLSVATPVAAQEAPPPAPAPAHDRLTPLLRGLYVSSAVLQGLDVHSTLHAMQTGNVETNPAMRRLVSRPAMFIGVKASIGTGLIAASHQMGKRDKIASIVMMGAINGLYGFVVVHNYRINR